MQDYGTEATQKILFVEFVDNKKTIVSYLLLSYHCQGFVVSAQFTIQFQNIISEL